MIKLSTVGTSAICEHFLAGAEQTSEFVLDAVYSRSYEKGLQFAKKHNCSRVFTDISEMAADTRIDAVYIASPNAFHYEQSRIFLENGKHVLCEKPITTSAEEYKTLKTLADKNGLIYMEAIMSRHNKEYGAIKKVLGEIGNIRIARIDFNQRSSRLDSFLKGEKVNIFDMSLKAGTFMDLGVYCVYAALDLLGKPQDITAKSNFFPNGADSAGCAVLDYGDYSAILTYGKAGQSAVGSEIIGERGTIVIPSVSQYTGITLIKDGKITPITSVPEKQEIMSGEAQHFADYILRFSECKAEYDEISKLCYDVCAVMDEIKTKAEIKYSDNK